MISPMTMKNTKAQEKMRKHLHHGNHDGAKLPAGTCLMKTAAFRDFIFNARELFVALRSWNTESAPPRLPEYLQLED